MTCGVAAGGQPVAMKRWRMPHRVSPVKQMIRAGLDEARRRGVLAHSAAAPFTELEGWAAELEAENASLRAALAAHEQQDKTADASRWVGETIERAVTLVGDLALPREPHVYLLRDEAGDVIYVGQSVNVLARLGRHVATYREVATATLIRCESVEQMDEVEASLIKALRPRYNAQLTNRRRDLRAAV